MIHSEKLKIALECIRNLIGVPEGWYVDKEGNLVFDTEVVGGSHGWTRTTVVRKATELDTACYKVVKALERRHYKRQRILEDLETEFVKKARETGLPIRVRVRMEE